MPKLHVVDGFAWINGSPAAKWFKKNRKRIEGVLVKARPKHKSLRAKALALAAAKIGVKESPPNSNHTAFGVWFGMDHEPWCAIFVSWVLSHVGRPFRYSYVPSIVADAKLKKDGLSIIPFRWVGNALKEGHVVLACYDWPGESPGIADHVGFVEKVLSNSSFQAIEGNTTPSDGGNQSNGGEVCRKVRNVSDVQAFVLVS